MLNEYIPGDVREERQARFEKTYKQHEKLSQPRITAMRAEVDIFPERRAVDVRGTYRLRNKTEDPVEAVHISINRRVEIRRLEIPDSRQELADAELGYYIYRLERPVYPGDEMDLHFDVGVRNDGFVNNGSDTQLVRNGTFFNNFQYLPHIGYQRFFELTDPNDRRKHGLPPIERMPSIDDEEARQGNYISRASDWIDFETIVSTSPDQIALAPGYLQREWTDAGRRYFHYKMDAPILGLVAWLSADWEVERDRWNDVAIEIYYHPKHPYNIRRLIDATKMSLEYFSREFGPYQHRQFRIVEFPRYARFAQSLPNLIPFSESIGFIARLDETDEDAIDYVFYVTAHEVAHQWWAHQVIGAHAQGATLLSETLAQYSALMVMEKDYGREKMRRFLKYELDNYLRSRGGELIEELPLLIVENQPYIHYRKGSVAMYALRDAIGEEALNSALKRYVRSVGFQGPPYTISRELLAHIREVVPDHLQHVPHDLFETITLYENLAQSATYERRGDGKYVVRLDLLSRKYRADGQEVETEIPVGDWVDVAVFGAKVAGGPPQGKILALEKKRIEQNKTVLEIEVDEEPRMAGIDPFNKLIDRNPENNLTPVK